MDQFWQRVAIAGVVIIVTLIAARIVDRVIGRRLEARAETWTRYQVLRRSAVVTVLAVGTLSALLVIPGVRAVAGTVLASSAVIALIIGFAAQTTLSNFVAGLFLAVTQPIRLGDRVDRDRRRRRRGDRAHLHAHSRPGRGPLLRPEHEIGLRYHSQRHVYGHVRRSSRGCVERLSRCQPNPSSRYAHADEHALI